MPSSNTLSQPTRNSVAPLAGNSSRGVATLYRGLQCTVDPCCNTRSTMRLSVRCSRVLFWGMRLTIKQGSTRMTLGRSAFYLPLLGAAYEETFATLDRLTTPATLVRCQSGVRGVITIVTAVMPLGLGNHNRTVLLPRRLRRLHDGICDTKGNKPGCPESPLNKCSTALAKVRMIGGATRSYAHN